MKTPIEKSSLSCPSYIAKPNAELFGIRSENGEVLYLKKTIPIDEIFIEATQKGRQAEERFRFSGKCIEKGCKQWESNQCGLVSKVIEAFQKSMNEHIQHCAIRQTCRWYEQEKDLACANCTEVFRNQASI